MTGILEELLCARCGHGAEIHALEGFGGTCMHRLDGECDCPVTHERIEHRAIQRMTAGLAVNTRSDPDAERHERESSENRDA